MGFGVGSLVDQENRVISSHLVSDSETTQIKINGSGLIKQGRSKCSEEDWRGSHEPNTMLNLFRSKENEQSQNMLCFSSPTSELPFLSAKNGGGGGLAERNSQKQTFTHCDRTHGYVTEGLNAPLLGTKCPFSPSQWIELEHQALVYKYIVANVPVPSNLLVSLKKTVNPFGLSSGFYSPTSFGWGTFHLGYSGNSDPELGRCRRTDGKKWRCSRDAVVDKKYCDRHINRGRHRSRKLVERRTGQAVSGMTAEVAAGAVTSAIPGSSASNSLGGIMQNRQPGAEKPSADALVNWRQELQGHPVMTPGINLKFNDSHFSIPPQKSSFPNPSSYNSQLDFPTHKSQGQNPLHLFINDFPKHQTDPINTSWSSNLEMDRTQLSMSIPKASSGFSSIAPPQEKTAPPPFRLSSEACTMDSAVDDNEKHTNWRCSMGGPLGEALNMTASSGSNHATRAWNGSPQLGSSPTGVLQKATFVSCSNSSEGGSPRVKNTMMANEIRTCFW